jgi:hypothetical protein
LIAAPRPLPASPLVVRRRYLAVVPKPLPVAPLVVRFRYLIVVTRQLPRRRDAAEAGEEQLGRCTARRGKYYRLYLYSGNVTLAAMYFRRVRVAGCTFAALTHALTVLKPLRLRQNSSAWASDSPAGGRRVAEWLGRWHAIDPTRPATPLNGSTIKFERNRCVYVLW